MKWTNLSRFRRFENSRIVSFYIWPLFTLGNYGIAIIKRVKGDVK